MKENYGKYKDEELLKALKGSSKQCEEAFTELYSRYSQRIYAYCLRIMGNPEDAKDIFQETFMKFYSSSPNISNIDNMAGYLLVISRNICLNYKRDRKIEYNIENYNIQSNEEGYEQKELMELVSTALELLEFDYREAFILRQYHGLSYKEISNITGDSIPAIKNRVWRSKEKLKDILSPYLEDMLK